MCWLFVLTIDLVEKRETPTIPCPLVHPLAMPLPRPTAIPPAMTRMRFDGAMGSCKPGYARRDNPEAEMREAMKAAFHFQSFPLHSPLVMPENPMVLPEEISIVCRAKRYQNRTSWAQRQQARGAEGGKEEQRAAQVAPGPKQGNKILQKKHEHRSG